MSLNLTTAPTSEPVTLAELKKYARVSHVRDDVLLEDQTIPAARQLIELVTHRALITQTYTLTLDSFPPEKRIMIPRPPLATMTSIQYVDNDGNTQTWSSSSYTTISPSGDRAAYAWVEPAYNEVYPSTRLIPNAVTITFDAGYGAAAAVPWGLKMAVLEAGSQIYRHEIEYERLRAMCAPWIAWHDGLVYQ